MDEVLINITQNVEQVVIQIVEATNNGGGGVTDHGSLTGLLDDDHTQYHNDARGDARYYTKSEVDTSLSGKANTSHSHVISDVTGLQTALDSKQAAGSYANAVHSHVISDITNLQTSLDGKANSSHSHIISNVTGLQTALDSKAASSHTHVIADVTGLQAAIDGKAATSHTHTSSNITDFHEAVEDVIGTKVVAGSNVTVSYNDTSGETTISASGGGGGGSPGGSNQQVQYNNSGAFAGASNVGIEGNNLKLIANNPAAPLTGLLIFARSLASRILPSFVGPSGLDSTLQPSVAGNSVVCVSPSNSTTAPNIFGGVLTTASTISHQQTVNAANIWQATRRTRIQTSATAGNATGSRTSYGQWYLSATPNRGGFFYRARFGMNINLNGGQKFIGLCGSTSVLGGDPSALTNMLGCGYDAADVSTGNWFFMHNDGSGTATKIDLGVNAARNTTDGYELIMFARPGGDQSVWVYVINLSNGNVLLDQEITTNIPANNTFLALKAEVRNGAVAAADNIEFSRIYIETDY